MSQDNYSFNKLYKEYYKKAYQYAKSYVNDDLAAEDIASEAMITVWEKMKPTGKKELVVFLYTILKNKSLDYLRKKSTQNLYFEKMGDVGLADLKIRISSLESSVPDNLSIAETHAIITETLKSFSIQTRKIFNLSRSKGLTNREIAYELGLSEKSIEYHISKVLKALRINLKDFLYLFVFTLLGK